MNVLPKLCLFIIAVCFALSAKAEGTLVASHAKNNGIVKCGETLTTVADFILRNNAHGSDTTWNKHDPDNRLFTSMTAKHYSDGDGHVTITAAPAAGNACDAIYVETFALEKSCLAARETMYSDWKYHGQLQETIVLLNETGVVRLYLSSQGSGAICLVSRKEVIYGAVN